MQSDSKKYKSFITACNKNDFTYVELAHDIVSTKTLNKGFCNACTDGNKETVEILLRNPRINITNGFYNACSNGKTHIIKLMSKDQRLNVHAFCDASQ